MASGALQHRKLALCAELLSVLDAFESAGIRSVPFKGPTLAVLLYDDPAARDFLDLDVLLHGEDVPRARSLLVERGYQPALPLSAAREALLLATVGQLRFVHADGYLVEIHTAFGPTSFPPPVAADEVWEGLQPVRLGGRVVATLGWEDLLLLLAYHGAKHLWVRLQWVRDVAQLLRVSGPLDWARLTKRARAHGAERILLLALHLSSELLDAPVPGFLAARARRDTAVQRLAARARGRMVAAGASRPPEPLIHLFRLRARERLHDKVRYLWRAIITPNPADWTAVPLSDRMRRLYYLVRPIRLAAKYAQMALRASRTHARRGPGVHAH